MIRFYFEDKVSFDDHEKYRTHVCQQNAILRRCVDYAETITREFHGHVRCRLDLRLNERYWDEERALPTEDQKLFAGTCNVEVDGPLENFFTRCFSAICDHEGLAHSILDKTDGR